jgi:basic amino acid/polyamine antiporter, APA family
VAEGQVLRRELGVFGAVMMGLGSIVGTGVFVSIGVAAGIAGPTVLVAVAVGAVVAGFNGLSSAQLAANHPVSGGTYEYGYRYLSPLLGFLAGWLFLIAKSASAATAALGFAGYLLGLLGVSGSAWVVPLALIALALLTGVVLAGIQRSNAANIAIVSLTLLSLALFVLAGFPAALGNAGTNLSGFFGGQDWGGLSGLLHASALMFVAYTGYGRIATLGEEVREPRRTIPRAIVVTLLATMLLYGLVAFVAVAAVGSAALGDPEHQVAPLEVAARAFGLPGVPQVVAVGAMTAMLGVLLNLLLGLSRVLLAMGRRRDVPALFGRLNESGTTPTAAVAAVGVIIALLVLVGDVRLTWSFSAFTVLGYYAITNLAALYLPAEGRLFPRWVSTLGLAACLGLAFFVEPLVWGVGLGLILVGVGWHRAARAARG